MADGPWSDFSAPPTDTQGQDGPWKDFGAAQEPKPQGFLGHVTDAIKGIPRNMIAGFSDAATAGAKAEALQMSQPAMADTIPDTEQAIKGIEKDVTGPLYEPQTKLGKVVGAGTRFASNPASYVAPGGVLGNATNAFISGVGSESLGQAAQGTRLETPLRLLGGFLGGAKGAPKAAAELPEAGPLGVTLSKGQTTGDLATIQAEQAAARGQLGAPAQERATQFGNQQQEQVNAAKENINRQFDPYGNETTPGSIIAETPQDAGQLVSQGVQAAAGRAKAGVKQAYDTAKGLGGELEPTVFEGIGQKIKGDLTFGENPVIIDDKLTPHANAMLQDLEENAAKLKVPNSADPRAAPNPEEISGISLQGVDQLRKRLSSFRQAAWGSGNASDGRAASAVLDAFDSHIDQAVNSGAFSGDSRAVNAWNDARAANADYRSTFSGGKNDPVGKVIEKIVGKGAADPEIPAKVADHLYGASGLSPNTTNVGVANRVRTILGEQSPEWTAVKQGLFSRLVENQGLTEWGAQKTGNRLNDFLNGRGQDMAKAVFTPQERDLLQRYVDLQNKLIIPPKGANWSNTAAGTMPMLRRITQSIATAIGAGVGHAVMPGTGGELIGGASGYGASKLVSGIGDVKRAKQIADQMPLVGDSIRDWQRAANNATISSGTAAKAILTNTANALSRNLNRIGVAISANELMPQQPAISPMQTKEGYPYYQLNAPQQKSGGSVERLERSKKRIAQLAT